jgi:hypothetical protein
MSNDGTQGYWTAGISPIPEKADRFSQQELENVLESNAVALRGWNYPHISRRDPQSVLALPGGGITASTDWERYKEVWRFYPSGLFVHRWRVREDGTGYRGTLHFVAAIYTLVEVFEFGRRLYGNDASVNEVAFQVSLNGALGRRGSGDDFSDLPVNLEAKRDLFEYSAGLTRSDLAADVVSPSVRAAEALFGQLGFVGISTTFIEDRVKRFLGGLR